MTEPTQRRVVCAAELHKPTEIVFCGARHGDVTMVLQILAAQFPIEQMLKQCFEQGFIDQFGVFMTREEALTVALAAGQRIYRCGGDEKKLYSENLY